ncbi:MAG: hypothetical protein L6Q57_08280 [Alphaproteobacteria bacterium]|nr:hypothetical protein [Alphaproteobacteria bacterium]
MANLTLPTDEEISKLLDGVEVYSCRPEDFVHFDALVQGTITEIQKQERKEAFKAWLAKKLPHEDAGGAERIADQSYLQKGPLVHNVRTWNVSYCFLMSPSSKQTSEQHFARNYQLNPCDIQNPIPEDHERYIQLQHEIGHACYNKMGMEFDNLYEDEFYADFYALNAYKEAGGDAQVIRDYIAKRALTALLGQPTHYWIAPALAHEFLGQDQGPEDIHQAYARMAELIVRLNVLTDPESKGTADIHTIPSQKLIDTIKRNYTLESPPSLVFLARLGNQFNAQAGSDRLESLKSIFCALGEILEHSAYDASVKNLGLLVMEGAVRYIPDAVPKQYQYLGLPFDKRQVTPPPPSAQSPAAPDEFAPG